MIRSARHVVLLTVVSLALVASSLAAARPPKAPPHVTEEQARQRAAAVAKAIDLPWDDSGAATFGSTCWIVWCRGANISLRGDTGQVVRLEGRRASEPASAAKPPAESEAITIAARAMKAFGAPPDAAFDEAELTGRSSWTRWYVCWRRRTANGIHYDGDFAYISFDHSGRVDGASLRWSPSAPPASTEVKIAKARAVQVAKDLLARERRPGSYDQLITARLLVVSPNGYYAPPRPRAASQGAPTRVAWVVSFPRPVSGKLARRDPRSRMPAEWTQDVVWVDAANAEVLGGKTAPASPPSEADIKSVISHRRWRILLVTEGAAAAVVAGVALGLAVRRRHRVRPAEQVP